ncbi:MAG: ATP-binding protein, partial [Acidimicrobiales bacterium]
RFLAMAASWFTSWCIRRLDTVNIEWSNAARSVSASSVAVASNLPFSEWGQVITDPRLVAAIVDRLTFRAHIIETGTESFRLRTSRKPNST